MTAPAFCSTCGAPARLVPRPGLATRAWNWFQHGDRGRGESYECTNGHGWSSSTLRAYGGRRRIRPSAIWQSLAFNRTVIPTPQSYAVMAAIGLIAGAGANLVFGWRWWIGPISLVAGSWAVALSTAFRGSQRRRTLEDLHDRLRPSGALERHRARSRELVQGATFAPLGLADPPHPPRLGGMGHRDHELHQLTIAYYDGRTAADPRVEVETSIREMPFELRRQLAAEELKMNAGGPTHLASSDPQARRAVAEWRPTVVVVDGTERPGESAAVGDGWVVVAELGERIALVSGVHMPLIERPVLRSFDRSELDGLPDGLDL